MEYEALKYIGAGLMGIGIMGGAMGVGQIFKALVEGIARNPSAENKLFQKAMIGAVLAEGLGIFALGAAFIMLFV